MRRLVHPSSLATLLAIATSACLDPAAGDAGDPATSATEQSVIICPTWECGSNSSQIDVYGFHDLNVNGIANDAGFRVLGLWKAGQMYDLEVRRGRILGHLGSTTIGGTTLQDAQIRLVRGAKNYAIRITNVVTVSSFARISGLPRPVETYLLDVSEIVAGSPATGWRNLCRNPPARSSPDLLGMGQYQSVVFESDRIDALAKTVDPVFDPTWFNIGCAGHALAKMMLNGRTEAMRLAYSFQTTPAERQAFLKMVTGDYCGTGVPFTVAGQPLEWMDARGHTQYLSAPAALQLEARWTSAGAACVNQPRVEANPTALGQNIFPAGVSAAIQALCAPPPCAGGVTTFAGATVLSANP